MLLGKEADHDTSTAGVRDLGNPDRTNTDPNVHVRRKWECGHLHQYRHCRVIDYSNVEQAQKDFDDQTMPEPWTPSKLSWSTATPPTAPAISPTRTYTLLAVWDIRGFQSVDVWWNHLSCQEARIALGEDNDPVPIQRLRRPVR